MGLYCFIKGGLGKISMAVPKRILALAEFIPEGSVAADIGTDHARLPAVLVQNGTCPRVIATDCRPGPLENARRNLSEKGLLGRVDLRLGDGLGVLKPGEASVLVLAGMGGGTIRRILASSPEVTASAQMLVLQPMGGAGELRAWLSKNGWRIKEEKLVEEGGRIYAIIAAVPGREELSDPLVLEFGPRLWERGKSEPLFFTYIEGLLDKYGRILKGLSLAKNAALEEKKLFLEKMITRLKEMTSCR